MEITAVRGAITVAEGDDEKTAMVQAMALLFDSLMNTNDCGPGDIVSIQFTQTSDLTIMNAASALRIARPDFGAVPLFCSQEPEIRGMLPRTVRVLVTWRGSGAPAPAYLGGAAGLRPDLQDQS